MGEKEESLPITNLCFTQKLSQGQIDELILKEREFVARDAAILEIYEKRNNFESEFYSLKEQLHNVITSQATKEFVDPSTSS